MITVTTNISSVIGKLIDKTKLVSTPQGVDKMLRSMAISTAGDMSRRIHNEGKKADGSPIGTYSEGYMKVRTGDFKNAVRFKRGKNKGKVKNAGRFNRGKTLVAFDTVEGDIIIQGSPRPNYKRTDDTKVVFSLTRQMENDFSLKETKEPIKTATGYGVGFKNPINTQKMSWLTIEGVGKKKKLFTGVYELSQQEIQKIRNIAEDFIANAFQTR